MTNQRADEMREAFERIVRLTHNLEGPWLRDCNDVDPQFTYQDQATEEAWQLFRATASAEAKYQNALRETREAMLVAQKALKADNMGIGALDNGIDFINKFLGEAK